MASNLDSEGGNWEAFWGGISPRQIVDCVERIAADFRKVVAANPDIAKKLELTGQIVTNRGPAEFGAAIDEQRDKLKGLASLLGLKAAH